MYGASPANRKIIQDAQRTTFMTYHFVSKVFSPLLDPGNLLLSLLLIGFALLWTRWSRAGKGLIGTGVAGFALVALLPIGSWILTPLENRFPLPAYQPEKVDGIIVLGGATNSALSHMRKQTNLNGNSERLTTFVTLARQNPKSRLVFTGGSSALRGYHIAEADVAEQLLTETGTDTSQIHFERESRNTWENAHKLLESIKPADNEVWLLVTSARHMPRAMGVFHKAGWPVQAWPTDFRTSGDFGFSFRFKLKSGLVSLSEGMREWTALVIYRMLDRTDSLFPGP